MISGILFYCLNAFESFIKPLTLLSITVLSHRIPFLFYQIFSHQQNQMEQVNQNTDRQKIFYKLFVKFTCSVVTHNFAYTIWCRINVENITRYTLKEIFEKSVDRLNFSVYNKYRT